MCEKVRTSARTERGTNCNGYLSLLEGDIEAAFAPRSRTLGDRIREGRGTVLVPETYRRGYLPETDRRSCDTRTEGCVQVGRWARRFTESLAASPQCPASNDLDKCEQVAESAPPVDRFSQWFQCVDSSRPWLWKLDWVPGPSDERFLLVVDTSPPYAFAVMSAGSGEILRFDRRNQCRRSTISCDLAAQAVWVAGAPRAASAHREAVLRSVPFPMLPVWRLSRRAVEASAGAGPRRNWVTWADEKYGVRWSGGSRLECDAPGAYRQKVMDQIIRGSSVEFDCTTPEDLFLEARACGGGRGCVELQRALREMWSTPSCEASAGTP